MNETTKELAFSVELNLTSTGKPSYSVKVKSNDIEDLKKKMDELQAYAALKAAKMMV